jgi:hypothetical protein
VLRANTPCRANPAAETDTREQRLVALLRVLPLETDQQGQGAVPRDLCVDGHQAETASTVIRSFVSQPA